MKNKRITERGQALVLVALAVVVLVGFTALAIDGSRVFSDRRHSQNASDASALAAALAKTREDANWKTIGFNRALDNGYDPSDGITAVDVYTCDQLPITVGNYTMSCKGLPSGADPAEYMYAHIKSRVNLLFGPVIGWREVINHTDAVVHMEKKIVTAWFPGYALISTMMNCPAYNRDPFTVGGTSGTTIINAGIMVNADCTSPQPAYDQYGGSSVQSGNGVCVVGAAQYTNTSPAPQTNCSPIDYRKYQLPSPACSKEGKIVQDPKDNNVYYAWPGNYGPGFNFDSIVDVNPAGTLYLQKGIYCLYNGIDLNSQWNITTDLNKNGVYDPLSEGVFFYVPQGDIKFNGSSNVKINSIGFPYDNYPTEFVNYLMYVPPTNKATIDITGSNGSQYTGTILAPTSDVTLNGGSGTVGLNSQVISYTVKIDGNGTLNVTYNPQENAHTTTNPSLEQTE